MLLSLQFWCTLESKCLWGGKKDRFKKKLGKASVPYVGEKYLTANVPDVTCNNYTLVRNEFCVLLIIHVRVHCM